MMFIRFVLCVPNRIGGRTYNKAAKIQASWPCLNTLFCDVVTRKKFCWYKNIPSIIDDRSVSVSN